MATIQEQVNLGVANANLLVAKLTVSYITWDAKKGSANGTRVSTKITSEFAGLVSKNLNPLYSSSVPITRATTTLTNFSVKRGILLNRSGSGGIINVDSLDLWNAQYVAWSIQLPTILQLGGISGDKSQIIISEFNSWYTTNIVPLVPKVKIGAGVK